MLVFGIGTTATGCQALIPCRASNIRINGLAGLTVDLLFESPDFLGKFNVGGLVVDDQVRNDVRHAGQSGCFLLILLRCSQSACSWPRSDVGWLLHLLSMRCTSSVSSATILSSFGVDLYLKCQSNLRDLRAIARRNATEVKLKALEPEFLSSYQLRFDLC